MDDEELAAIAESDEHARWVVTNHVGNGTERSRCDICEQWWPCDLVGLAALAVRRARQVEQVYGRLRSMTGICEP